MQMGKRLAGGIVAAVAIALNAGAQPAGAADPLPVGEALGVRIVQHGRTMTIVFAREARALYRRVAGREVNVMCQRGNAGVGSFVTVPRTRMRVTTGNDARRADYCRIVLEPRGGRGRRARDGKLPKTIVSVPLTQAGAVQLDEELRALEMWTIFMLPADQGDRQRFPTPERLVADFRTDRWPIGIVALGSPTDMPPADEIGYWSDGGEHAIAVTRSATGRRLFVEYLPDRELRTNVVEYLLDADAY